MPLAENWLPVVGWEGLYEVSDHGQVRSLDRVVAFGHQQRQVRGRILGGGRSHNGVRFAVLCNGPDQVQRSVHRLVLEAFVGPCPEGMEGCHWDDDNDNNHLSNLRWDTHQANEQDKVRNGGHHQLNKTHCPAGHEYTPENTKQQSHGRACRECIRIKARAAYRRNINEQRVVKRIAQRNRRARLREMAA